MLKGTRSGNCQLIVQSGECDGGGQVGAQVLRAMEMHMQAHARSSLAETDCGFTLCLCSLGAGDGEGWVLHQTELASLGNSAYSIAYTRPNREGPTQRWLFLNNEYQGAPKTANPTA